MVIPAKFDGTVVFDKLATNRKPFVVCEGSTGSTKTYSIVKWITMQCSLSKKPIIARSFRKVKADCKATVGADFLDIMQELYPEIWEAGEYNKSEGMFYFHNGSKYHFAGCDDGRLHGYKQHIAHLEECIEIDIESYRQIEQRTSWRWVFSFNPAVTDHWVFDILEKPIEKYCYIHSTYKDNPYLSQERIDVIESREPTPENIAHKTADDWHWQVYGLGKRSRREGAVYTDWEKTSSWPKRSECQRYGYGMDFGFTLDPTVLVECALFQDELYIREVFSQKELTTLRNPQLPEKACIQNLLEYHEIRHTDKIIADSARPETIQALKDIGYNIIPCKKGPGSIQSGIDSVKRFRLRIHESSSFCLTEVQNYVWDKKRQGFPKDEYNHSMDAVRYFVDYDCSQKKIYHPYNVDDDYVKKLNRMNYSSPISRR